MAGQFNTLRLWLTGAVLALAGVSAGSAVAETRLVMAEEVGCVWCEEWNEAIGPIYPKTAEGRAAPLMRIDIHEPRPDGLSFTSRLQYTPTFVLMQDGLEVGRIEGYPGEDFFWGLLQVMLGEANIEYEAKS